MTEKLEQTSAQLKMLGDGIPEDEADRIRFVMQVKFLFKLTKYYIKSKFNLFY